MALIAKEQNKIVREPTSIGMHPATCYAVFDIGTHIDAKYGTSKRKIVVIFEIPGERIEIEKDGEKLDLPKALSSKYTLSLDSKAILRQHLDSWRGRAFTPKELGGFDVFTVIGAPCLLNVTHNEVGDKVYQNIASINPVMKGMEKPKQENPSCSFSFDDCEVGKVEFPERMPEWIRKQAMESAEWEELMGANTGDTTPEPQKPADTASEEPDEDCPF